MSDLGLRVAIVVMVTLVVSVVALMTKRGIAIRRRPISTVGIDRGFVMFVSDACSTCRQVTSLMDSMVGPDGYRQVSFESDPETFRALGIDGVPTLVHADGEGGGWRASGIPSAHRLARWVDNP